MSYISQGSQARNPKQNPPGAWLPTFLRLPARAQTAVREPCQPTRSISKLGTRPLKSVALTESRPLSNHSH